MQMDIAKGDFFYSLNPHPHLKPKKNCEMMIFLFFKKLGQQKTYNRTLGVRLLTYFEKVRGNYKVTYLDLTRF